MIGLAGCGWDVKTRTAPAVVEVLKADGMYWVNSFDPQLCSAMIRVDGRDAYMQSAPKDWCRWRPEREFRANLITLESRGRRRHELEVGGFGRSVEFREPLP